MSLARYTFLPWLRRGIVNQLTQGATTSRAQLDVSLTVNGDTAHPITKTVSLIGPGDVVGINQQMIVRTEPRNLITDFEPNYLAFIEFYDEDFPWRYTPDRVQNNHRLSPWIALVVLKETEFTDVNTGNRPLPAISIKAARNDVLPPPADTWAWAHVHLNEPIDHPGNQPNLTQLDNLLRNSPDLGIARLMCPRHLEPNTAYHAFLIPAFEIGRKAGLGEAVNDSDPALTMSWAKDETGEKEYPVYYRWFFRTGVGGDFESLVRLLQPRDMDKRVGIRDMDMQAPGFGIGAISVQPDNTVGLEGALLAPTTERKPNYPFDSVSDFPEKVQPIINLSEDVREANGSTDPVITPPLYGKWHALISRLSLVPDEQNWVHELNQDPRYRVPAGMGTLVVQKNQEDYMRKAWQQIGDVLSANQKIRFSQLAMLTSIQLHLKHLASLDDTLRLALTGQLHKKVRNGATTVHFQVQQSLLPVASVSGAFRKLVRPRGLMAKRLEMSTPVRSFTGLIQGMNTGKLTAAPAKVVPSEAQTLPAEIGKQLDYSADAVKNIGARGNFKILLPGQTQAPIIRRINRDNAVAKVFRTALTNLHEVMVEQVIPPPVRQPAGIKVISQTVMNALNPLNTFPIRVLPGITQGTGIVPKLDRVMAYPDIRDAMYEPLVAINKEFFVPNLNLILPNTLSLMVTNQPFIEAYMVGLNHEFMRELLWREYPTDQRGTPFRQFWKPIGDTQTAALPPKVQAEKQKDIPPINEWLFNAPEKIHLGDHNHRLTEVEDGLLVLVIRGDLLKRYPNTVIYAQQAQWGTEPDSLNRLVLVDTTGQAVADGVHIKNPIYKAQIDPDLHFIGFDLSIPQAKGDVKEETAAEKQRLGNNNLGWFFVIQQVPGEPRFGLDDEAATNPGPQKWDNLSWNTLGNTQEVIDMGKPFVQPLTGQNPDAVDWNTQSADLAYILFQKPVMVAVHAREMLKNLVAP
ncbi:hypothetical protein [Spirosoma endbachense]|uniref:Uncharacterized protein n=1 Tax=Spirosoma endbachense TaxID=2666025 RepID=A0A6P1VQR8_9BACT|nr:hypothetical protein [Spirosoma endbachense]QHV95035.1 hypothetical protein GJR95_08370 [Spirosoma endbachense]